MRDDELDDWQRAKIMHLFGPPTVRERLAYYWREARREVRNPELYVAVACVVAVGFVQYFTR